MAIQFPNRATTVQVPVPVPVPVLAQVLVRIQSITQPAKHMRVRLLIVQLLVQLSDRRQQHDLICASIYCIRAMLLRQARRPCSCHDDVNDPSTPVRTLRTREWQSAAAHEARPRTSTREGPAG